MAKLKLWKQSWMLIAAVLVMALGTATVPASPAAAANLCESYTVGDDASRQVQGANWRAQTFTPDSSHSASSVVLKLRRQGNPGNVTVSIKATDSNGHPTGIDLTSATLDGNSLTTDSAGNWYDIPFTSLYTLAEGAKYAIVLRTPSGNSTNRVMWRVNTAGGYAGGSIEQSSNSGSTWGHGAADCMFEVWGDPVTEVWVDDDWAGSNPGDNVGGHTFGYDAFATIQDGVNAVAGSTVHVAAGTYHPVSTIVINKDNLVLQGPQADIDPRPSQGSTRIAGSPGEAIIDGTAGSLDTIIEIDADNVTINGFEVKSGTKDLVLQGNPHSGNTVGYCIIHDGNGDDGAQLKKATNGVLEYNYVYDIADPGDALSIADGSDSGKIRHNEIHDISTKNAAIHCYGSDNMEIVGNLIYSVASGDGIRIGNKNGDDTGRIGGLIKDNIIYDVAGDGINVLTSHVTIEGNDIRNCGSEDGAIFIRYAVTDITIHSNNVHDNVLSTAKRLTSAGILVEDTVDASNVTINCNSIYGNEPYGVTNESTALLDATKNWWGSASGPSGAGAGSGDAVSANVDYHPWLHQPGGCNLPMGGGMVEGVVVGSGPTSLPYIIAGGLAVMLMLMAGGWYASRRRLLGRRY